MSLLLFLTLFLSFISYSCGQYCLCKPGSQAPDPYKKVIDYACGNGANCGPVQQNGPCYQPNDVQAVCSYAANSYYQNKKSLGATCDFGGVAAPSTLPSDLPSGCSFPTSGGATSTGTGISTTTGGGTTTPGGGMGTGTNPNIFTPTGLGPTGGFTDPSGTNDATSLLQISTHVTSLSLTLISILSLLWA
ncbi:hypothetical protein RND81_02G210500 [Saponaria officinalis]|uniref:X8 domain-containing protein n=1 Tax=Saponaria officinalis TaxID=3572 RepID=A0AAW1MW70_SAPOF